ncbi:M15 family metallopeptidase [Virgibacillus siamensis]|uniref:M15 family metallopeptidase n=1 Tax=Virgibacillus siamensis TaxID=480071 RepID=UPI000985925F|nr:M15 family metallopeptidase [Virgibacillus siamensis]
MKFYRKDITAWILIILFVGLLFILYNQDQQTDPCKNTARYTRPSGGLDPTVAEKTEKLIQQSSKRGINVAITDKVRSKKEQNALYARGRTVAGSIVTFAKGGESYHNYGLAIDYALRNNKGEIIWSTAYDGNRNGHPDWFEVAEIAKELGFEWGGDWRSPDYPHLQMDFGLSIQELQKGIRPDHSCNQV